MKKSLLLIAFAVLILSGCSLSPEQKAAKEKAKFDSILSAIKAENASDSLVNVYKNQEEEKNAPLITTSIAIIKYYTSNPNSAGGVDANIIWKNISDKIVKYARFTAAPYNAVDDMVSSEIGGETLKKMKVTGPVKPGSTNGYGSTWECIWYNHSITHMKITGIELEYMDGTIISTNNVGIIDQVLPKKK